MNPFVIAEPISVLTHELYLRRFPGNVALPLDGSTWCRLVNMRRRRERLGDCLDHHSIDLYIQLHTGRKLRILHAGERKAVAYWFIREPRPYVQHLEYTATQVLTVEDELGKLSGNGTASLALPLFGRGS
ncbi:MAG: hypothetical protein HY711_01265 [Candidatus Melainabacteria bacterium]|nr:hypothetical protein [Candidatus Melainabacteria bacterium]